MIGVQPATSFIKESGVAMNSRGFVIVDKVTITYVVHCYHIVPQKQENMSVKEMRQMGGAIYWVCGKRKMTINDN